MLNQLPLVSSYYCVNKVNFFCDLSEVRLGTLRLVDLRYMPL